MQIAFFIGSDVRNFGGGEKFVIELSNRLKYYNITIFSYKSKKKLRVSLKDIRSMTTASIKYYNAIEIKSLQERFITIFSGIRTFISLRKFDTIYCTAASLNIIFWLLIFSKVHKKKFILGIHYVYFLDNQPFRKMFIGKYFYPLQVFIRNELIRNIDFVHVLNNYDKETIRKIGYRGKIFCIPNFSYNNKKIHLHNESKFVVVFVGRISVEHKGLDLLENVIRLVNKKCCGIRFEIIGSGSPEDEAVIKRLVNKYKNVKWFGFLSGGRLAKRYLHASLFVMPSRIEGFPLSLLEAQSYGLPAVAFNVKGSNNIIKQHTGALVQPFNVNDFAHNIIKYYKMWSDNKSLYLKFRENISNYTNRQHDYANVENLINKMMQPL